MEENKEEMNSNRTDLVKKNRSCEPEKSRDNKKKRKIKGATKENEKPHTLEGKVE